MTGVNIVDIYMISCVCGCVCRTLLEEDLVVAGHVGGGVVVPTHGVRQA